MSLKMGCLLAVLNFLLLMNSARAAEVPDVTVDHHNSKQKALNYPNTTTITAKQIKQSGATHISEVLASQSSIQVQDLTGDGSHAAVSMRGFGDNAASNTLIMINGVPQNNPDIASANLNQIPIQDVKQIDIIHGSNSVLYGDQAVGGVINIITKQPRKATGNVSIGYGSYNHQLYHANFGNAYNSGFDYLLSLNRDTSDNYREHNSNNQNNASLNMGYKYKNGELRIRYDIYHQKLLYAGALTLQQLEANRRQAEPGSLGDYTDEKTQNLNLLWKRFINASWVSNNNINYRYYTGYGTFQQSRQVLMINPKIIGIIDKARLLFGSNLQYDHYSMSSSEISDREQQSILSAYTQWQQDLTKKFIIRVGARAAHMHSQSDGSLYNGSTTDSVFVSEQALLWKYLPDATLFVKRAGSYRFPKSEENATILPGTSHLKTQTGTSYDLGTRTFIHQYRINIDFYYMTLNNEIVFNPTPVGAQKFGTNRNLPPTSRSGFNLGVSDKISNVIKVGVQYSYVDARFRSGQFKGNRIPFVADNSLHGAVSLHFKPYWSIYNEAIFTGDRYAAGDDTNTARKIPSLWIFNSAISYHYKKITVSLRINNLFNVLYNDYVSTTSGNAEAYYPAPGRNVMLTLGVNLW